MRKSLTDRIEPRADCIPTGSTLLNLALSDNPYGGWKKGSMGNLVGDTDSGKTFISWNMFADVVRRPEFDKWDLEYDDIEHKLNMNPVRVFGDPIKRVKYEDPVDTIEELYTKVKGKFKKGSFIYVPDSYDALTDKTEKSKTELKKDYSAKAILGSQMFRKFKGEITDSQALLLIISQVREKIGATFGMKKKRSGGKALDFYATHIVWLAAISKIKKRDRIVGVHIIARCRKNHLTFKDRTVEFDILQDYGLDDIGSMVDWMIKEGFWKKKAKSTKYKTEFIEAARPDLLDYFADPDRYDDLIQVVGRKWAEIEEDIKPQRKPRYS